MTVLLFCTYYICMGEITGTCAHNLIVYKICKPKDGTASLCFKTAMKTMWVFELQAVF